jgi:hypothetical protein
MRFLHRATVPAFALIAACALLSNAQSPPNGILPQLPIAASDFVMVAANNTAYVFFQDQTSYYAYGYMFWRSISANFNSTGGGGAVIGDNVYL